MLYVKFRIISLLYGKATATCLRIQTKCNMINLSCPSNENIVLHLMLELISRQIRQIISFPVKFDTVRCTPTYLTNHELSMNYEYLVF